MLTACKLYYCTHVHAVDYVYTCACRMPKDLDRVLTDIDNYYSRKYHIILLKFLAQCVVPYGQIEPCDSVHKVYEKIKESNALRSNHRLNDRHAVALLRHMIQVTLGSKDDFEEEMKDLGVHCCTAEEFSLIDVAPSLPFLELLLILTSKLLKNNHYKDFLVAVEERKLNKSRHDISSPVDLFQSMILKGTLVKGDYSSLKKEVIPILEENRMTEEVEFMRKHCIDDQPSGIINCFVFDHYTNSTNI